MITKAIKTNTLLLTAFFSLQAVAQSTSLPKIATDGSSTLTTDKVAASSKRLTSPVVDQTRKDAIGADLQGLDLRTALLTEGGVNGGGGDETALLFRAAATQALADLKASAPESYKKIANLNLTSVIKNSTILVVDDALNVKVKDLIQNSAAFNSPDQNIILLNRARINEIRDTSLLEAVALHEMLSLKHIEYTGNYSISGQLVSLRGKSMEDLATALKVNRVQQIQALNPKATPWDVLSEFFKEANDSISMNDFPSVDDIQSGKAKMICQQTEYMNLTEGLPIQLAIVIKPATVATESKGPLFPATPAVPATLRTIPYVLSPPRIPDSNEISILNSVSYGSTLAMAQNQLLLQMPGNQWYEWTFRKNNGMIVFKSLHKTVTTDNPEITYGYCY